MTRHDTTASAAVSAFIDAINRNDLEALAALMSEDHLMVLPGEQPIRGRDASLQAWRSYFESFPDYLIFRRHMTVDGNRVVVFGTTTGSDPALPPEDEMKRAMIWQAEVTNGAMSHWQLDEDTPQLRAELGVPTPA